MIDELQLRRATEADYADLWRLHEETMSAYIAATWGWDEGWQAGHFRVRWHPERLTVITWRGRLVGVFHLEERRGELYLETIEIAPAFQSKGVGTAILSAVIDLARARGWTVRLHVLRVNRARRLYERLGFSVDEESETRYAMSIRPKASSAIRPATRADRPDLLVRLVGGEAT